MHRKTCHDLRKSCATADPTKNQVTALLRAVQAGDRGAADRLLALVYVHAWALIVAVQWFWEHQDHGIDIKKDPWWTLAFRRQWQQKHSGNSPGPVTTNKQKKSRRGKGDKGSNP
jgi:hypothetical protein